MGTSRSSLELARKFDALSHGVKQQQKIAERAGGRVIEKAVAPRIKAATGGDGKLSGMGPKARRITVVTRSTGAGALVKVNGPAQLIENDVDKHYVVSKYAKGAQRVGANGRKLRSTRRSRIASVAFGQGAAGGGRRAVLNLGNGQFRRWTVAYSKGRHPWRHGVRASRARAVQEMRKVEAAEIARVFR